MAAGLGRRDGLALSGHGLDILGDDQGDGAADGAELLRDGAVPQHGVGAHGDAGDGVPAELVAGSVGGQAVGVEGHLEGLVVGDRLALIGHVDHPAALGVAHVDVVVNAVELVGAEAAAGDGAVSLHGEVLGAVLQPVLQLLAGHLDHVDQVVVILVEGVAVLQADGGGLSAIQQLADAEVLVGHGRSQRQVGAGGPQLSLMDQVHGVALDVEQVGLIVPLAGQGANLLGDEGQGPVVIGLHEGLQTGVVLVGGQVHVLALADGEGAVGGDGDGGLGQGGGAAVDTGHSLAVGILHLGDAHLVVVAGDDHVDAGGVLHQVADLVLGREIGLAGLHGVAVTGAHQTAVLAGVAGDDDKVTALLFPHGLLPVVGPLVGISPVSVVLVDKVGALVVGGQVPVGHVHVLKAQNTHLELLAAHVKGHDLVGLQVGLLGGDVDVVGTEGIHRGTGVLIGGVGQHVIENLLGLHVKVELMVAGDKGVVADVPQADGHGVVHAALHVHVVADDGAALDDVAVVDEDGAVHGRPLFLHGGGHLQIAVLYFLAVNGVEVVAFSVHVGGGVDAQGEGLGLRCHGRHADAAQQHGGRQSARQSLTEM
ncbi:Uncharacterised protein [uncultured Flavonifractor sp.]|nr:Uncharacterised protein [uncultured Flavonifractor sp.]